MTAMQKLTRDDLMSLEKYAEARPAFREKVMAHKRNRRLDLGTNAALYFEDYLTMQYQVQEMLRIERIFEVDGINEELEAYNPLIPDGSNWKATFMVEFPEVGERRAMLEQLLGIEDRVYVHVADFDRVYAIADEDLDRSNETKTSAVHFLRFELPREQVAALKAGASLAAGIDHENYRVEVSPVAENIRQALVADFD
jgi:DNA primase large subunit